MEKSKIKVDIARNRLCITVYGTLSKERMDDLYTEVRFGVADLKYGFYVINDLSGCSVLSLSGVLTFKKIMDYLP